MDDEVNGSADLAMALLERAAYANEPWKAFGTLESIIEYLADKMKADDLVSQRELAEDILDEISTLLLYLKIVVTNSEDYIEDQTKLWREIIDRATEDPKEEEN